MTPKTKVLKILDKYRDKNVPKDLPLPIRWDGQHYFWGKNNEMVADIDLVQTGEGFRIRGWGRIQDEDRFQECAKYIEKAVNAYEAATPLTLLKALQSKKWIDIDLNDEVIYWHMTETQDPIHIPLTTTLTEVPEEHEMWQAVLDVLI